MKFETKLPKGIFARGEQNPSMLSSGNKGQLTVVACTNAAGFCIPPMVIIDLKTYLNRFVMEKFLELYMHLALQAG